jgi:hypothetical protein
MERDTSQMPESTQDTAGDMAAPKRREFVRRLAKAGVTLPVAVVIYNASTTVAHAS